MCVSGIVIGLWRYRFRRRYALKGELSGVPYVRLMLASLLRVIFRTDYLIRILSGLLSMNPGDWSPGVSPTEAQIRAAAGGALPIWGASNLARPKRYESSKPNISRRRSNSAISWTPLLPGLSIAGSTKPGEWLNTDLGAFPSAETPLPHLLIAADD